jgi:thermitase
MARFLEYYAGNRKRRLRVQGVFEARQQLGSSAAALPTIEFPMRPQAAGRQVMSLLHAQPLQVQGRFDALVDSDTMISPVDPGRTTVIPTETVAVTGAKAAELRWARREFGLRPIQDGSHGKVLLTVGGDSEDPVGLAARAARALFERGNVDGAHPNFLRLVQRPAPAEGTTTEQWGLDNPGNPGVMGADVAALAAWTVSEGNPNVRVAVLDEGVDTAHPYLKDALVAERDFVENNATARPEGDDAHGTACAGIIGSRSEKVWGLAPKVSLVAARIAKGDGGDGWLFDDFNTADAIDWCWDDAAADVLSNSWGGGPPVDVITAAFSRACNLGRKGKGAVVVVAAGNAQNHVSYPGTLPDVLTVGASNQWDERKTRTSADGETWWGSNFGKGLDVMAPGVQILTTDISGRRGYGTSLTIGSFNGTSAATPFVAAVAALLLSVGPSLDATRARDLITSTGDRIGSGSAIWDQFVGFGRVNAFAALRAARRL